MCGGADFRVADWESAVQPGQEAGSELVASVAVDEEEHYRGEIHVSHGFPDFCEGFGEKDFAPPSRKEAQY